MTQIITSHAVAAGLLLLAPAALAQSPIEQIDLPNDGVISGLDGGSGNFQDLQFAPVANPADPDGVALVDGGLHLILQPSRLNSGVTVSDADANNEVGTSSGIEITVEAFCLLPDWDSDGRHAIFAVGSHPAGTGTTWNGAYLMSYRVGRTAGTKVVDVELVSQWANVTSVWRSNENVLYGLEGGTTIRRAQWNGSGATGLDFGALSDLVWHDSSEVILEATCVDLRPSLGDELAMVFGTTQAATRLSIRHPSTFNAAVSSAPNAPDDVLGPIGPLSVARAGGSVSDALIAQRMGTNGYVMESWVHGENLTQFSSDAPPVPDGGPAVTVGTGDILGGTLSTLRDLMISHGGDSDVFVAPRSIPATGSIFNYSGTTNTYTFLTTSVGGTRIASSDFDRDGDEDAVFGLQGSGGISIRLNPSMNRMEFAPEFKGTAEGPAFEIIASGAGVPVGYAMLRFRGESPSTLVPAAQGEDFTLVAEFWRWNKPSGVTSPTLQGSAAVGLEADGSFVLDVLIPEGSLPLFSGGSYQRTLYGSFRYTNEGAGDVYPATTAVYSPGSPAQFKVGTEWDVVHDELSSGAGDPPPIFGGGWVEQARTGGPIVAPEGIDIVPKRPQQS